MGKEGYKEKRVAVLMGGLSKEREISLRSGKAVASGLREAGYLNVIEIDAGLDLPSRLKDEKIEACFIALHGRFGEDGTVQGILEYLRIPYTGSGVLGASLSMDKAMTKRIFQAEGIPTARFAVFRSLQERGAVIKGVKASGIGFPLVVKPTCEGSTIGVSFVEEEKSLDDAVSLAFEHDAEIVVEKFIAGTEVTVGILDGKALPLVEIAPKEGVFDFKAKYTKGMTEYYVPARVSQKTGIKVQEVGLKAAMSVCVEEFGRVDVIIDGKGNPYVLEVNAIPGLTETSLIPKAAKEMGLSFSQLVSKLMSGASCKVKG